MEGYLTAHESLYDCLPACLTVDSVQAPREGGEALQHHPAPHPAQEQVQGPAAGVVAEQLHLSHLASPLVQHSYLVLSASQAHLTVKIAQHLQLGQFTIL